MSGTTYYIVPTNPNKREEWLVKFLLWVDKENGPYISWWRMDTTVDWPDNWRGLTYKEATDICQPTERIIDEDEFKRLRIGAALSG